MHRGAPCRCAPRAAVVLSIGRLSFGTRGFRHSGDPDPMIHRARLRDPLCADRRACRICFDQWSRETVDRFDEFLEGLHGRRGATTSLRGRSSTACTPVGPRSKSSVKRSASTSCHRHRPACSDGQCGCRGAGSTHRVGVVSAGNAATEMRLGSPDKRAAPVPNRRTAQGNKIGADQGPAPRALCRRAG